jgi:hypothetical protein
MIKFFRKIRQGLLSENKFTKYLIYAIGEIVLVVIGILIALQVNSWNEHRISHNLELKLLKDLHNDLETDLQNLSVKIKYDSLFATSNDSLFTCFKNNNLADGLKVRNIDGTLYNWFGIVNNTLFFYPQKYAYQNIINSGIDIIENETLRQDIMHLYDYSYRVTGDYLQIQFNLQVNTNDYLWNNLETKKGGFIKIPNDTTLIKQNQKFINFLSGMSGEYWSALGFYRPNREAIISLIREVDKEIRIKEK